VIEWLHGGPVQHVHRDETFFRDETLQCTYDNFDGTCPQYARGGNASAVALRHQHQHQHQHQHHHPQLLPEATVSVLRSPDTHDVPVATQFQEYAEQLPDLDVYYGTRRSSRRTAHRSGRDDTE